MRILRDKDCARDVTQDVFLRCFGHRRRLRPGRELLAWLYRVATNLCLNAVRDRRLRAAPAADGDVAASAAVAPVGPFRRVLWELLHDEDARTQAIVIYVYLDGMTHAEAAAVAQVSDRTVRACLARFQARGRSRLGSDLGPLLAEGFG